MKYLGDFVEDDTVHVYFTTSDMGGAAVAPSSAFEAADLAIYKDGSATQKTTTNGVTMTSPFDAVTGLHHVSIDTSNDTGDAGFWVTGSDYTVILNPDETIDGQTVVAILATFSIQNRFMRGTDSALLASSAPTNFSDLSITASTGRVDVGAWLGTAVTTSATTAKPEVDSFSISDNQAAADSVQANIGNLDAAVTSRLAPTVSGRTLDVATTGEAGLDLGNVTGVLGNANVGWVDGNNRVDVGSWLGTAVTTSATTAKPEVDSFSISDNQAAADNVQANIGNLDATVSSRSTVTTAQVNAEVVDALATDTYAEPGQGTPAATATLAAKINYLYKAWRNRTTQTSSEYSLYNDDATTVDQKSTVSDNGTTFDRGEVATGP